MILYLTEVTGADVVNKPPMLKIRENIPVI